MKKIFPIAKHLTLSVIILVISLLLVFLSFHLFAEVLNDPGRFFISNFSSLEIQNIAIKILIIIVCILFAYVVYLLLLSRSRLELAVSAITESLTEELERFEKLYEEAPVPYILLNEKGEIFKPNKAALRFFGVVSKEIEGKNLFYYQSTENKEKTEKLARYYESRVPINREEVLFVTRKGNRWALLSVFNLHTGSKRGGLASIFDITDQKKLDQAKTEFVSLASHQLRAPVATTKWFTEMLLSDDLGEVSPKQKEYLERIHKVGEEMTDLVDTLLNISRIEIGTLKVELKSTNVRELVESILLELSAQITEKKLEVIKKYDNHLENLESDPKLLRIVIQNLISNAVKYTPPHGTITILFKEFGAEKSITVSDTGIGIPVAEQSQIFSKLFRAENAKNMNQTQGIGLGLYMVKSIIETLEGSVGFVSKEGEGASFTIKL